MSTVSKTDTHLRGDVVIAFSADWRLTAADLAALNPDQIKALFEAVGTVAALTNRHEPIR